MISKQTRADAALICAVCASTPDSWWLRAAEVISMDAAPLAHEVYGEATRNGRLGESEAWAEAEAMLRTGWEP